MEDSHRLLLHLSVHASASCEPPPVSPSVEDLKASSLRNLRFFSGKVIAGLGQWWRGQKEIRLQQPRQYFVASDDGNRVAVIDGFNITFLSRDNAFANAIGTSTSTSEAGYVVNGVWLGVLDIFAVLTSCKLIVMLSISGRELARISLQCWKSSGHALGMFIKQSSTSGRYSLAVLASDCNVYHVQCGHEGFTSANPRIISYSSLKKMYPWGLLCHDHNSEKSILAVAGLSTGSKISKSAGCYCLSLWKIQDFWDSLELLGFTDIMTDSPIMPSFSSLKLVMSPSCHYVGLIESQARLRLVCLQQAQGWALQEMQLTKKNGHHIVDTMIETKDVLKKSVGKKEDSNFSYFEVASEFISKEGFMLESLQVKGAFWWSNNAIFLLNEEGSLFMVSLPELQISSKFVGGFSCDELQIVHGKRRCIFLLDNMRYETSTLNEVPQTSQKSESAGWRLLSLREHTVPELFEELLQNGKFDFALSLAGTYDLEKEKVYKMRWLCSSYELKDIEENLPKIQDTKWLLKECLQRICPSMEAMNGLLQHGLHVLDLLLGSHSFKHAIQDSWIGELCLKRIRILQYSDRLETYLGLSMGRYNSKDYKIFRSARLPDVALSLAGSGKIGSLYLLYKHHMYSLTPFLLKILDEIPETIGPHTYDKLLPQLVPPQPYIPGRERDWVEDEGIVNVIEKHKDDETVSVVGLRESTEYLVKACIGFAWPSEEEMDEWYRRRATEIDYVSGQLENVLTLLDLGKQKGFVSLESIWDDISTLHWVTYNSNEDITFNVSLQNWQQMSDYDKFKYVMKDVNEANILDRLKEQASSFINRKSVANNHQQEEDLLLVKWLKDIAQNNQLQICDVVMEACKVTGYNEFFGSEIECIKAGLDCVYICSRTDQWDLMMSILSKLSSLRLLSQSNNQTDQRPGDEHFMKDVREGGRGGSGLSIKGEHIALNRKIQQAINHVEAGRLLSQYQVPKPIGFFEATQDERGVKQLIILMLSKFSRRQPMRSDAEWASMWDDLQRLQSKAFTFLNKQFLFLEYYRGLLKAGKFSLAKSQLRSVGNSLLSREKAEAIIIQAAREYFYSSSSLDSPEIEKARMCLNLMQDSKTIAAEMDVIDAITIKLPALGVSLIPMQVKQVKDPMEIVKKALISSSTDGNLRVEDVLDIARSLGINSDEHIAMVEEMIARESAASGRISLALDLCLQLMKRGHGPIWDLCAALARGPEVEGITLQLRKELLGFALSYCDEVSVWQLLNTWKQIDLSKRCIEIRKESTSLKGSPQIYDAEIPWDEDKLQTMEEGNKLLCKVTQEFNQGAGDETFLSKERKKILPGLCIRMPWLLQAAGMESTGDITCKQHDDLTLKSVSTILLGLAHTNLIPRDELVCYLAHDAMLEVSKDSKSLVGCGYLLNLSNYQQAVEALEKEFKNRRELKETCKIMRFGLMYGSLQYTLTNPNHSVKHRREKLLMSLRQSKHDVVSDEGPLEGNVSDSMNIFWKQWQSNILHKLSLTEHAVELEPYVTNFKLDQFVGGDEDYVKHVIQSFVDSAKVLKNSEPLNASKVDRYQAAGALSCVKMKDLSDGDIKLSMNALVDSYQILKKYIRYLGWKDKWIATETLFCVATTSVLKDEGYHVESLCSLLNFWVVVFTDSLEGVEKYPEDDISREVIEFLSDMRSCCQTFVKLIEKNTINMSQAQAVVDKLPNLAKCGGIRERFLEAMVSCGCAFQSVVLVQHNAIQDLKSMIVNCSITKTSDIPNIYIQVISSSIIACDAKSFDEYYLQLEPVIKAVSSLCTNSEVDSGNLNDPLKEVRTSVWKLLTTHSENRALPSNLRVWLLKLREAIVSESKEIPASNHSDDYLQKHAITWIGWEPTTVGVEKNSSVQQTIAALKSTELVASFWQDVDVKVEDLDSVDRATTVFNVFADRVNVVEHAILLVRLLEGWRDIFGWEAYSNEGVGTADTTTTTQEEIGSLNAEWGQADGWDDEWEDYEEKSVETGSFVNNCVHVLHECWKIAFKKLACYGDLENILQFLDTTQPASGRSLLTEQGSFEVVNCFAEESPNSALKVSLLVPYESVRNYALENFDRKLKSVVIEGKVINNWCLSEKGTMYIDECLLTLVLASGHVAVWADNPKFSTSFCLLSASVTSTVLNASLSSSHFALGVILPSYIASLVVTSQYAVASALILQLMRIHPSLMTWNVAFIALEQFLKVRRSQLLDKSDIASDKLGSLTCICNNVSYLQCHLGDKIESALKVMANML